MNHNIHVVSSPLKEVQLSLAEWYDWIQWLATDNVVLSVRLPMQNTSVIRTMLDHLRLHLRTCIFIPLSKISSAKDMYQYLFGFYGGTYDNSQPVELQRVKICRTLVSELSQSPLRNTVYFHPIMSTQ